ncbi:MAG: phosphate ABC transporter permease, partial [Parahaliea sp.]
MMELARYIPPRRARLRRFKDRLTTVCITAGGVGVLLAILLIFFFLLHEVAPLFGATRVAAPVSLAWPAPVPAYLSVEEQGEVGLTVTPAGEALFFRVVDGATIERHNLAAGHAAVTALSSADGGRLLALGHADGEVTLSRHGYRLDYIGDQRVVVPSMSAPYPGLQLRPGAAAIQALAVNDDVHGLLVVAEVAGQGLRALRYSRNENLLTGEVALEREALTLPALAGTTAALYIGADQRWLYRLNREGVYTVLDLQQTDGDGVQQIATTGPLFEGGGKLAASALLLGDISLLAASDRGELVQYFMVRDRDGARFQRVRDFDTGGAVPWQLLSEHQRKGFAALGGRGELQLYHSTAGRHLYSGFDGLLPGGRAALSPRGDLLLYIGPDRQLSTRTIHNEHPEVSWLALWDKLWYESYDRPEHIWQSSGANSDYEPKYSLAPLVFGTLKAAFYTMLLASPLAVCGAIYTGYF